MTSTLARNGCTVMIVDDSEVARNLLRDILEECGYVVVGEAADGVEVMIRSFGFIALAVTVM